MLGRDCFDAVYGSSAGAINATYFLSGQREGVDIYSQDIANTEFCDMRRLLQKKGTEQSECALSAVLGIAGMAASSSKLERIWEYDMLKMSYVIGFEMGLGCPHRRLVCAAL